ncbi:MULTISPECIES: tautomerase family protein [unclassified Methylobacterium]|jgi:phenylpyruvate tautomerase PptA (4-oxalocrotonate tautomerase family)|uniref:tautomerase family protein n=1 Tax=unclassified Methylobacterium TaxID=2615210 RepID=UPI0013558E2E|nr:tautomerase family protein [Methylobacterium sp. 2A]MWV23800.1 tautomerase family protein [Methylobacterium sp. 2A]
MPLTRISLRAGTSPAYRAALIQGLYAAQRETFAVPEDDLFAVIHEHDATGFAFGRPYLGIARDADLVLIQITANATRTIDPKRALDVAIARNLAHDPGAAPGNVCVNLVEVAPDNWSFGDGLMQYGPPV